jgi:hypothetical protein
VSQIAIKQQTVIGAAHPGSADHHHTCIQTLSNLV